MKKLLLTTTLLAGALFASPMKLYTNGTILTMDDAKPKAEAVAVKDGKILAVGTNREVEKVLEDEVKKIDLHGKTMLPGFIDSHSHITLVGNKLDFANLSSPPAGPITSIKDIQEVLRKEIKEKHIKPGHLVAGLGYNHAQLKEHRHLTREDLDAVSTEHPVVAVHFSFHQAVFNTKALEMAGIDENTPDPKGGKILRYSGTNKPTGLLQEKAWIPFIFLVMETDYEGTKRRILNAQNLYLSKGYTTIQEAGGIANDKILKAFRELGASGKLKADIAGLSMKNYDEILKNYEVDKHYKNHFRLAGVKIVLDGGSPGRSAYLREPYYKQMPGEKDYRGVPLYPDQKQLDGLITKFYKNGWQTYIHALGDGAIDMALHAMKVADAKYPKKDRRSQLIHTQLIWPDQMDEAKKLGATDTFQITHVYYFGDFHCKETFGPQRCQQLCPIKTAMEHGLNVTIHHDAAVHPVNQMFLIWTAVNRVTRSGRVLNPDERISVMDALKASTINAAYQMKEDTFKGSIALGKMADFVVLDENPLTVDPMKLKDIKILETIKEGETVYKEK